MGLFGSIGGFFKGLFGGSKDSDKVKIAEIERDTKLRLADKENQRIEIMKNARIEALEKEYYFKSVHEESKVRGFNSVAQTVVLMQDKLNEMSERSSLNSIKEIEGFYKDLGDEIQKDNDYYNFKKYPRLLETMERFDKDSDAYNMYKKRIDRDMEMQSEMLKNKMNNLSKRQDRVIDGFLKSKDKMLEQNSRITSGLIENMALREKNRARISDKNISNNKLVKDKKDNLLLHK